MKPAHAPTTLALGELAVFFAEQPFVVKSQDRAHPFYVAATMTGAGAQSAGMGDPEVSMVPPTDQWLDAYGFFSDYTYPLSTVVVARRRTHGVFHDVVLDCAGALMGWKTITADVEWTYAELTRSFVPRTYAAGSCTDGMHRIESSGPFTMTMWGMGVAASYGYPGGTGLRPLTDIDVPVVR